jgi:hypothetical protein
MDARPSMASALAAFGIPVVVTRPEPGSQPVSTTGIWIVPLIEDRPIATDLSRREPRRVLAIPRNSAVPEMVRSTVINAAEYAGGTAQNWRVDGIEQPIEVDCIRVIVVPAVGS